MSRPAWRCRVLDASGQTIKAMMTSHADRVQEVRTFFAKCDIPAGGRAEYQIRHVEGDYPRGRFVTHAVRA